MHYDSCIVKIDLNRRYLSSTASSTNLNVSKIHLNIDEYLSYVGADFYKLKCNAPRAMAKCVKEW